MKLRPTLLVLLALLSLVATLPAAAQPAPEPTLEPVLEPTPEPEPELQATGSERLYLPYLAVPPQPSVFGAEVRSLTIEKGLDLLANTSTDWVRRNSLRWAFVEPERGDSYKWDAPRIQQLEREMIEASERGFNFIVVLNGSPRWAVAPYAADCAPINPAYYEDYARFLAAVVSRYSKPPYNVKYWEIGNEPDAYIFPNNSGFGCWGVEGDPYYGGEAYGNMLRAVVPAMRRANPEIKILNGGLLLYRPYDPGDPTTLAGRFFEGMLRAGAGNSFDIVSFHSYDYYGPGSATPLGARVDWRIDYLGDLLERYNIAPKPMLRTESGLLCPAIVLTAECRWAQADFVARLYARSLRDGLLANLWYAYDTDSFHNTAMIEPSEPSIPRQTYFAYRHASRMLAGARYLGPIPNLPDSAEGYRFATPRGTVFVFWSDTATPSISLAIRSPRVACTNRDGGPIPCSPEDGSLTLPAALSPTFVLVPSS